MMQASRVAAVLLGIILLTGIASAQFNVWVVDDDGGAGVDFTTIQGAIEAASANDVILVRDGQYDSFSIQGAFHATKLALTADAGAVVLVEGPSRIVDLPLGGFVSLRGLQLRGAAGAQQHGLNLDANAGAVWIESSTLRGSEDFGFLTVAGTGLIVTDCDEVVLTRCVIKGGVSLSDGFGNGVGAAGLVAANSQLALYETSVTGGKGHMEPLAQCPCALAGTGVHLTGGFLFAKGSTLTGGPGDSMLIEPCFPFPFCEITSPGGTGLVLALSSQAHLFDSTTEGGSASADDVDVNPGSSLSFLPGLSRSFAITSPLAAGETGSMSFVGSPGDVAYIVVAFPPEFIFAPQYNGVWQLGAPGRIIPLLPIPPSGTLSLPYTGPQLDPAYEALTFSIQSAFEVADGIFFLAEPARVIVLAGE